MRLTEEEMVEALHPATTVDMQALVSSTETALKMFNRCLLSETKNPVIYEQITGIKKVGQDFRGVSDDSITQSEQIALFADDLVEYADFCMNWDSVGDIEMGATALLSQAQDNRKKSQELLDSYKELGERLREIRENLADEKEHILLKEEDIRKKEAKINNASERQHENSSKSQRCWDNVKKGAAVAAVGGVIAISVAIPPIVAIESVVAIVSGATVAAGATVVTAVEAHRASSADKGLKEDKENIYQLNEEIAELRKYIEKSIETIDYLNAQLEEITKGLCEFEGFWSIQCTKLEDLIRKLDTSEPLPKFSATSIKTRWFVVGKECKKYGENIRSILSRVQIEAREVH